MYAAADAVAELEAGCCTLLVLQVACGVVAELLLPPTTLLFKLSKL
jgi:hypothetical protein